MNQKDLGKRLRQAREQANISQQAAADKIKLPRTAITQLELGNRSVSTLELTKLAALYHCPVTSFLNNSLEEDEDVLVALYRMEPKLQNDHHAKEQINKYIEWCRIGASLEKFLGYTHHSEPPTYPKNIPHNAYEAFLQGEETAEQERNRLRIGEAPIADMADLINDQNIWASGASFPENMSGLFLSHKSIGLAIFVNASHSKARKRFSYAHEYAHALLDRASKITVSDNSNTSDLIEKRANAFAAAFLMPNEGIRKLLNNLNKGKPNRFTKTVFDVATEKCINANTRSATNSQAITYQDIAIIAHHFGVSYQAAVFRLKSLNYISQPQSKTLLQQEQIGKNYLQALDMWGDLEGKEDKKLWDRELRNHLVHLAIEAYRREEISQGKLLDIANSIEMPPETMIGLAEAASGN